MTFGSPTADNQVNFTDNIDLNGEIRRIDVVAGTGGDSALISGVISNVQVYATNVGLQKTGAGTLILSGSNTYNGTTTIASGVLQAVDGVGLPSTSNLVLSGSIAQTGVGAVLQSSGTFDRSMGTAAGQLQWSGDGGFAASGGSLLSHAQQRHHAPMGQYQLVFPRQRRRVDVRLGPPPTTKST